MDVPHTGKRQIGWAPIPLAAVVGAIAAAAVWLFKRAIEAAEWLSHGWYAEGWSEVGFPWIGVIPIVGGLLVGAILHLRGLPDDPGHGVSEVIETVTLGGDDFPEGDTAVKAPVAALSLGSGASLGPEDPAVEIGGSIGGFAARRWGLPRDEVQALVAAGAAGGLAAAFHAPLAALVFAHEVFSIRLLSRTLLVIAVGVGVAFGGIWLLEPEAEPAVPHLGLENGWEIGLSLLVGAIGGAVSAAQIRLMYTVEHAFFRWKTPPRWLKPAIGGVVLGLAGLAVPELLGVGYETLEPLLRGERPVWTMLLVLMAGKMVLMAVSFGSGFIGGFFAPSLFIGAAMGSAFGVGAAEMLPQLELRPEIFAVAGMGAVLAGGVRAPFAVVLLITALSGSYELAPLLVAATLPAYAVSRRLEKHSLYTYAVEHPEGKKPPTHPGGSPAGDSTGRIESAE